MNQNICPITLAKQKLMENSIIKRKSDINSKPKLRTYKMFMIKFFERQNLTCIF